PLMNGFAVRYASTNLVVVAIDVRESETTADDFARSLGATFPVGLDTDGTAHAAWGALVLPVHFWIDASGVIRERALGGIGPDVRPGRLSCVGSSGRASIAVAGRVRVGGARYLGNHGLETGSLARRARAEGIAVTIDPALLEFSQPTEVLARRVAERLRHPKW